MRITAYVLAGDPAWADASVASYYDLVDRIVVSFDGSHRSWAGHPLSVEESLRRIRSADPDGKTVLLPGDHAAAGRSLNAAETAQRQFALDAASENADWVLQLDTDEFVASPEALRQQIRLADERAAGALEFPLRNIYAQTTGGRFLETCGRFWTTQAAFPGPVAVRAGTTLTVARQAAGVSLHRVDVRQRNTDPAHPGDAPVHAVVRPAEAILHLSWVRTEEQMLEKSRVSGYSPFHDWGRDLARWRWRARHPWLTAAAAPLRPRFDRHRVVALPIPPGRAP